MNPDTCGSASMGLTDDDYENQKIRTEYSTTIMTNNSIPTPPPLTSMKNVMEFRKSCSNIQNIVSIPNMRTYNKNKSRTSNLPINDTHVIHINTNAEEVMKPVLVDKPATNQYQKPNGKLIVIRKDNKYHKIVIPYDVLPILNDSVGPVHIKIPDVGYVDIKSASQFQNEALNNNFDQVLPFSVDFETVIAANEQKKLLNLRQNKELNNHESRKMSPERSKEPIVKPNTNSKMHEATKGFTRLEAEEAGSCIEYLNTVIREMQVGLQKQERKFNAFKRQLQKKNRKKLANSKSTLEKCDYQLGKRKIKTRRYSDYLYEENEIQTSSDVIKPCYVLMERNKYVEAVHRNMLAKEALEKDKNRVKTKIKLINDKFISTSETFISEMSHIKPILLINEHNFKLLDIRTYCSKTNLAYALNEDRLFPKVLLNDDKFITAVKNNYIKIVDSDLLYGYILGEIGPTRSTLDCVPICKL